MNEEEKKNEPEKIRTKKCKYCKSDIPADAKICPYCRKKQKKGIVKWIIIVIVAIIIIAAAAGGGNSSNKTPEKVSSQSDEGTSSENADNNQEESSDSQDSFTIGDTADFDGIQVTLSTAILSNGDGEYVTPDDGKYFLGLVFDIDNQSDDDIDVSSIASFEAYCDDTSINQDLIGPQSPELKVYNSLDGDVASGKKMNGVICYQVPEDFTSFEIRFSPSFWGNNEAVFTFTRDAVDSSAIE